MALYPASGLEQRSLCLGCRIAEQMAVSWARSGGGKTEPKRLDLLVLTASESLLWLLQGRCWDGRLVRSQEEQPRPKLHVEAIDELDICNAIFSIWHASDSSCRVLVVEFWTSSNRSSFQNLIDSILPGGKVGKSINQNIL